MNRIARTLDSVTEIAYWEYRHPADSGAPTLVLIHGLGLTSQVWVALIELLRPNCSVLAVDVPGYGDSPKGGDELTIDSVAQRIADLIDSKRMQDIILIGHSMGGFIALKLASRLTSSLRHIVLLDSTLWRAYRLIRTPLRLALRYPRILVSLGAAAAGAFLPYAPALARFLGRTKIGRQLALWPFVHRPSRLVPDVAESIFEDMRPGQPLRALQRSTRAFDLASLLSDLDVPLTAIAGANDGMIAAMDVRFYEEHANVLMKNITIQACGHWPMVEAPAKLEAILRDALGEDHADRPEEA